jgi:gamma-glutamyltranspeptidase/glutathione hydrolase
MLTRIFFSALLFFFSARTFFPAAQKPVKSKNGMAVSASDLATLVGTDILRNGGNAIDAAVAVGFALAVTFPEAGNLGGGGFMVIHFEDGKNTTIDFREKAPSIAHEKIYLDSLGNVIEGMSTHGWTSSGVPGSVAGLIYALEKYGTMSLQEVIAPAIVLARDGFPISESLAESLNYTRAEFEKYPSSKKIFVKEDGAWQEGDYLIQEDLARTLEEIATNGAKGFYEGWVADSIAAQSERNGWKISLDDLKNYAPVERAPIIGNYRGYEIVSMPPPSSGGVALIETLNALENFNVDSLGWNSGAYVFTLTEILKHVYADRSEHLGDPDFYPVKSAELTDKAYALQIVQALADTAIPSELIKPAVFPSANKESEETTHYSIADAEGNAVSVTTTINSAYGNKIVVNGCGFLMNNEMDDFSVKPGVPNQFGLLGSKANSVQAGKRMLSSMTPTIVLKNDSLFMVIGSPGGSTIITTVLQCIVNAIDFKMNISEAIAAPRFHHQWMPDEIFRERFALVKDVENFLERKGEHLGDFRRLGFAQGIIYDVKTKTFYGATDPRGDGLAASP